MFGWLKSAFKKREVPAAKVVEPAPTPAAEPEVEASATVEIAAHHPINRDMDHPSVYKPFADVAKQLVAECHKQGLMLYPFEVYRSNERQHHLYEQGRTRPGPRVTNADAGLSFHNYGLAFDLVFDADNVKPGYQWTWDGNYAKLGKIIHEKFADKLTWAGDWTSFKEYPHVQWKTAVTVQQLKAAGSLQAAWSLLKKKAAPRKAATPKVAAPSINIASVKPKKKKKAPAKKKV